MSLVKKKGKKRVEEMNTFIQILLPTYDKQIKAKLYTHKRRF